MPYAAHLKTEPKSHLCYCCCCCCCCCSESQVHAQALHTLVARHMPHNTQELETATISPCSQGLLTGLGGQEGLWQLWQEPPLLSSATWPGWDSGWFTHQELPVVLCAFPQNTNFIGLLCPLMGKGKPQTGQELNLQTL